MKLGRVAVIVGCTLLVLGIASCFWAYKVRPSSEDESKLPVDLEIARAAGCLYRRDIESALKIYGNIHNRVSSKDLKDLAHLELSFASFFAHAGDVQSSINYFNAAAQHGTAAGDYQHIQPVLPYAISTFVDAKMLSKSETMVNAFPDRSCLLMLGIGYRNSGKPDDALRVLTNLANTKPFDDRLHYEALYELGCVFYDTGRHAEAEHYYKQVDDFIRKHPQSWFPTIDACRNAADLGDYALSLKRYQSEIESWRAFPGKDRGVDDEDLIAEIGCVLRAQRDHLHSVVW